MKTITLQKNQQFNNRVEISALLGGDKQKGIATTKNNTILLFTNDSELYSDYFYPKGSHDYCLYTGIGRIGHQDSIDNNMYNLNLAVLSHANRNKTLLVFEKQKSKICFVGQYVLIETHQNIQPDDNDELRRVFVFHLKKSSDTFEATIEETI